MIATKGNLLTVSRLFTLGTLLAASCVPGLTTDSRELTQCENELVATLKAPSSYKRIKYDRMFMQTEKPQEVWVTIEYDAVNSFNAPLRDQRICKYPATAGGAVDWAAIDRQLDVDVERIVKDTKEASDVAKEVSSPVADASKATAAAEQAATAE